MRQKNLHNVYDMPLIKVGGCLCHDASGDEEYLTEGNYYQYIDKDEEFVLLQDDNGNYNWFCVGSFSFDI